MGQFYIYLTGSTTSTVKVFTTAEFGPTPEKTIQEIGTISPEIIFNILQQT
jgi:hypothetical protein